jgi:hypothetical protein
VSPASTWLECLVLEKGLPSTVVAGAVLLIVLWLIIFFCSSFLCLPRWSTATLIVAVVLLVGLTFWHLGYKFPTSVFDKYPGTWVVLDTQGIPLEIIGEKYQIATKAKIKLSEKASHFHIRGRYVGRCVADLLEKVCKQYSNALSCHNKIFTREIYVLMK